MKSTWTRRMERHMLPAEVYVSDLEIAQLYAQKALEALQSDPDVKRGVWYRWKLRRAKNALTRLYKKELNANKKEE